MAGPALAHVAFEPYLLTTRDAARFIGRAERTLKNIRAEDRERIALELPIQGPPWVVIGRNVYYRASELRDWTEAQTKNCGTASKAAWAIRASAPQGPGSALTESQE